MKFQIIEVIKVINRISASTRKQKKNLCGNQIKIKTLNTTKLYKIFILMKLKSKIHKMIKKQLANKQLANKQILSKERIFKIIIFKMKMAVNSIKTLQVKI